MNACFFLTLLVLCTYGESVDVAKASLPSSFFSPRRALTSRSILENEDSSSTSEASKQQCPPVKIDYYFKRSGFSSVSHTVIDLNECIEICRINSDRCVAVNYAHNVLYRCTELQTLGPVSVDLGVTTVLVNYAKSDDPCDEKYFLSKYTRHGFSYDQYFGEIAGSPEDCCRKCINDPKSRCVVWTYDSKSKVCWLQDYASTLIALDTRTAGFGVTSCSSITPVG